MINVLGVVVYLVVGLAVARRLTTMRYKGHSMFDDFNSEGEEYFVIAVSSAFWVVYLPITLLTIVGKWFVTGGVRKEENKRKELTRQLMEMSGLMNFAKTDDERKIISDAKRDIERRLGSL